MGVPVPEFLRRGLKKPTLMGQVTERAYQVNKFFKVSIFMVLGLGDAGQTLLSCATL